jgi:hypothetical protein
MLMTRPTTLAISTLRIGCHPSKSRANQTINPQAKITAPQNRKYQTARGSAKLLKNREAWTGNELFAKVGDGMKG